MSQKVKKPFSRYFFYCDQIKKKQKKNWEKQKFALSRKLLQVFMTFLLVVCWQPKKHVYIHPETRLGSRILAVLGK